MRSIQGDNRDPQLLAGVPALPVQYVALEQAEEALHGRRFKRLAARAGLPEIRFYDLRHTYITASLMAGVSPKVVSQRAGHADVAFTMKTCQHALPGMDEDAAALAASYMLRRRETPATAPHP